MLTLSLIYLLSRLGLHFNFFVPIGGVTHTSSIRADQMCLDINFNTLMSLLPVNVVRRYLCIPMTIMETVRQMDRDSINEVAQDGIDCKYDVRYFCTPINQ
jgi:hypothetical protein